MKKRLFSVSKQQQIQILKRLTLLLAMIVILGNIYKLKVTCIIISFVFTLFILPVFYKERVKEERERKKFESVIIYLEQILYSFKKRPKIREALYDAQKVGNIYMKEIIEEAVVNIDSKVSDDIYGESLKIIEEEFDCKKIRLIHDFMVKVERDGGEARRYIDILLNEIKAWNDRTKLFMNDVLRVKKNFLISIFATLITCAFMVFLIPDEYEYSSHIVYQVSTVVMFITMLIVYIIVIKKLNFNWIYEKEGLTREEVDRYYSIIYENNENLPVGPKSFNWIERSNYNTAKKKLKRELTKEFPNWLIDVAINIQNETVQSAIENSYHTAPYVLKEPIRRLLLDFEEWPVGIEPYDNFLKEFELAEIQSTMKMMYSLVELGKEEADVQISSIIDRNHRLQNQASEMKNKEKVGIATFLMVIPMFVGVVKIMTDMLLMVIVFTSELSKIM